MSGSRGGGRHRRRRLAVALAAILACVLTSSGCAIKRELPGSSGSRTPGRPSGKDGGVPIGVDIELSGPAAEQGHAYKKAVTLAADLINSRGVLGGREIRLIIRDNRSDPAEALRVAKELIRHDHIVALVGGGTTPTTLSLARAVEKAGVPTISMGASEEIVHPAPARRYLFKTTPDTAQVVRVMLEDMSARGFRRVGVISTGDPYDGKGAAAFTAAAGEAGLRIIAREKLRDLTEDSAHRARRRAAEQVQRVVMRKPDTIVCWAGPRGASLVAQDVQASGFAGRLYLDAEAGAEPFLAATGTAANGVFVVHPVLPVVGLAPSSVPNYQRMRSFQGAYAGRYGSYPASAGYAADALGMLVAAMEEAGTTDPARVRDALEHLHYVGVTGVYAMSPDDHAGLAASSLRLLSVRDGRWVLPDSVVNGRTSD